MNNQKKLKSKNNSKFAIIFMNLFTHYLSLYITATVIIRDREVPPPTLAHATATHATAAVLIRRTHTAARDQADVCPRADVTQREGSGAGSGYCAIVTCGRGRKR